MESVNRIMELLNERGIEQRVLAEYIGISAQAVSQWKSGANKSYIRHINKIAEFFDVSADYLLCKDDIKKRPASSDVERLNKAMSENANFKDFVERYMALPEDEQQKLHDYLELLTRASGQKED